jgi:hypothetical protein
MTLVCATALLFLNRRLYRLFFNRRGFVFLCGAIAYHWLYFFYGGLGFLYASLRCTFSRRTDPAHAIAGTQSATMVTR